MSVVTESLYASKPGTNNGKYPSKNTVEELKLKSMHPIHEGNLVKPILSPQVA